MSITIRPLSTWEEAIGLLKGVRHTDSTLILEFEHGSYSIDIDSNLDSDAIAGLEDLIGHRVSVINTDLNDKRISAIEFDDE